MPTAIVIGAGPAGATTALLLARRRWSVTLIEQHRFPRDKVCGECLSALGMRALEDHGLADRIRGLGAIELRHSNLYGPDGETARVRLDEPMWGIRRADLDGELLAAALEAGVELRVPARVEAIEPGERPTVRVRGLEDNLVRELSADRVFLADGKGALTGGAAGASGDLGVKAHFRDVTAPPGTIGLYALHGHYVGLAPVNRGAWNLAFGAPARRVKAAGSLDRLLAWAVGENAALRRHLGGARRVGAWLVAPLPRFGIGGAWPRGVVPVGNAAAALEPIGGEGMGLAIASAAEAVRHVDDLSTVRGVYRQMWDVRRAACRAVACAISRPAIAGAVVELAAGNEGLTRAMMAMMGKSPAKVVRP